MPLLKISELRNFVITVVRVLLLHFFLQKINFSDFAKNRIIDYQQIISFCYNICYNGCYNKYLIFNINI